MKRSWRAGLGSGPRWCKPFRPSHWWSQTAAAFPAGDFTLENIRQGGADKKTNELPAREGGGALCLDLAPPPPRTEQYGQDELVDSSLAPFHMDESRFFRETEPFGDVWLHKNIV